MESVGEFSRSAGSRWKETAHKALQGKTVEAEGNSQI